MTICNMSIEAGARAGMIAPDETTFEFLKGRARTPRSCVGRSRRGTWKSLVTDDDATFNAEVVIDASTLSPFVTWGNDPGRAAVVGIGSETRTRSTTRWTAAQRSRAIEYMG